MSSLEYNLPPDPLPENRRHEPRAQTDRRPCCARPAPRSLSFAPAVGNPFLRGLAILEIGLAEGDLLEHHPRPVQNRIPCSSATPRNRRGERRLRRIVFPCTAVPRPVR